MIALDNITNTLPDEDDNPLKEDHNKAKKGDYLDKPSKGYFDMVFKKRPSEATVELRPSSNAVDRQNSLKRERSLSREVFEVKTQTYYTTALKYNYLKKTIGPLGM